VTSENAAGEQRQPEQAAPSSAPKPKQGEVLLQLAADLDLFHDPNRAPYATFAVEEHRETHSLRSHEVRDYLARLFFRQEGKPPNTNAIQDALSVGSSSPATTPRWTPGSSGPSTALASCGRCSGSANPRAAANP
jgi:hypothetical protein